MSTGRYFLYSMQLSWYSAKVRPYLRFRRLPFDERTPTAREYYGEIKRRCGHAVVPIVITPDGEWLQDSSVIIERLEERFPGYPIVPTSPRQHFAAYLLELWADEFWLSAGVHARWSFPENYPKWRDELATAFAPGFPTFVQRLLPLPLKWFMQRVNTQLGATPDQVALIERWMAQQLDHLERHFALMPYVFGARPSLADFSLAGPICGHLRYDESASRRLLRPRPRLYAWSERMMSATPAPSDGPYLADDAIPESLVPLLDSAFHEMVPMLAALAELVRPMKNGRGGHLPRIVGKVTYPYAGERFTRHGAPYMLWMAQRLLEVVAAMPADQAAEVRRWVASLGGQGLLDLDIPRVTRVGVHAALA
ncbi:MAG TPA: glutathione S-transferase family protein [Steroidobacteraceae bacterium]|nr:glutathione S-transferase family protein [Steroidobacteraceae bacterium]HQR47869.1 glutathione S-transferase family protein [Steroidobacteraceae bacterium]